MLRLPPAEGRIFGLRAARAAPGSVRSRTDTVYAISGDGDAATHARLVALLESAAQHPLPSPTRTRCVDRWAEEAPERYLERVRRAKEYIAAGDIYQANLSRPWRLRLRDGSDPAPRLRRAAAVEPGAVRRLRAVGGRDDPVVVSGTPAAGRGPDDFHAADRRHAAHEPGTPTRTARDTAELVAHPKERAEHIMLIDLERNDVGRVCEAGSVRVDEYMVTETYAHVHHIVSNVRGTLRADRDRGRRTARAVSRRHHHRLPQGPLHADHRRRWKARGAARTRARWAGWARTVTRTSTS